MRRNGFTLVEVIVVSVIVAIIATTATMLYSGYIKDSAQRTVEGMAKVAASSANAYYRKTEVIPIVEDLKLFNPDEGRYTITAVPSEAPHSIKVLDNRYGVEDSVRFIPEE